MANEWIDVSATTPRIAYTASASQSAFTVPFVFFEDADLIVYQNGALLILNVDYTVSGAEDSDGGTVTLVTAATLGDEILIVRRLAIEQTAHIPPSGPLDVPAINVQFSRLIAIAQQLADDLERSIHFPNGDAVESGELLGVDDRKNKLLGFDTSGNPIAVNGPDYVSNTDIGAALVSTRAVAEITTFDPSIIYLVTGGTTVVGDGGGGAYKQGTGSGSFTDGGGTSWVPFAASITATAPEGRLTLISAQPVMPVSATAATAIYYAPFIGTKVPINNGGVTQLYQFTSSATDAVGLSLALGSNWAANSNYDVFIALRSGVVTLATGPTWSAGAVPGSNTVGASARGTGAGSTDLQMFNGFLTNKNSITLRYSNTQTFTAAANEALYVGTFRTGSAGQISFTYGAQGTAGTFNLWNCYNQVLCNSTSSDNTASWTYSSATIRQANASSVNQFNFITGLATSNIVVSATQNIRPAGSASAFGRIGVALNATNVLDKQAQITTPAAGALDTSATISVNYKPQLGANYVSQNEQGDGTNSTTFFGQNFQQISVSLWM